MALPLEFAATIQIIGINPYVHVSAHQAKRIKAGWRKPIPVFVQVNNKPDLPWQINMMPMGNGDFYLYLHNKVREASQTKVGDNVHIKVWFDDGYQNGPQHEMPNWFEQALQNSPRARENWASLPPSRQKEILRYFAGLKSEAAKERNIQKAVHVLSGKPGRFMAREWKNGK
jgi:hypothetical protein